jgi:uncharacterized protein
MNIIDVHTHIFPPDVTRQREKFAARDRSFARIYGDARARMADINDLLAYIEGNDIERCVACGYPFRDMGLLRYCNDYVLEAAQRSPRIMAFTGIGRGPKKGCIAEAERCLALGTGGFGEASFPEAGDRTTTGTLEAVARLAEAEYLPVLLHVNEQVGHQYPGKAALDLAGVVRFAGAHKGMRTILAHLGGGLCFYEFMPEVKAALDHAFYDTSATPFLYSAAIYDFLARFLGGRALFGSDFPLMPFSRYNEHLSKLSDRNRERLLFRNAAGFFGNG